LIADGIDLAIRVGEMENSVLKSKRVGRIDRKLVCSPEYAVRHEKPKQPEELATWKWIKLEILPEWQVESLLLFAVWPANIFENSNSRRLLDLLFSAQGA
jgi:DNA-binding transcriptional LysR family regulator